MRKIIICLMMSFPFLLKAQDPTFSYFNLQKLDLNPAYGGSAGEGKFDFNFAKRVSYFPVRGPFKYLSGSLDFSPCKFKSVLGLGLIYSKESQGDGYFSISKIGFNIGVNLAISNNLTVSMGIRPSLISQSIDWNEFTFSDQLDPIKGSVYSSSNNVAPIDLSNASNWDSGLKLCIYGEKFNFMLGGGVFNLFEPKIGLLSFYNLSRRYSIINSNDFIVNNNLRVKINDRFEIQNDFKYGALNVELMFFNRLRLTPGLKLPVFNKFEFNNNILPSVALAFQFNSNVLGYITYENNIIGKIIGGKTNSIEIGLWINTESVCHITKISELMKSGNKVKSQIGCPDPDNSSYGNFKIKSF